MARRWIKNLPTADRREQAQFLYWTLTFVGQFLLVDFDNAGSWPATAQATDGIVSGATPSQFRTPSTQAYLFSVADVGRYIAIRDNTTPGNSGIFRIQAVPNQHTLTLNAPVANFQGSSQNVLWTIFDVAGKPPDGAWFVVQAPNAPAWQARVTCSAAAPAGVKFDLGAYGGWNTTTNAWTLPASTTVQLNNTTAVTFAVVDEQIGAFFCWSEDNPNPLIANRTGVYCGTFAGIHSPAGQGVPRDDAPVVLLGDNTATANTLNRLLVGGTAGFAIHGQIPLPDHSGYAPAFLHQWRRISDDSDVLADAGATTDPRSGQTDSFGWLAYQVSPGVYARGYLPLLRVGNDFVSNRTLLNGGSMYAIQAGVFVEWDGSSPI